MEAEVNHQLKPRNFLASVAAAALLTALLAGCSQTAAPEPSIIQRAQGEAPAPPPPSGFLGSDYSLLAAPATDSRQNAMLVYTNPAANLTPESDARAASNEESLPRKIGRAHVFTP